jgi:hypothetical protein
MAAAVVVTAERERCVAAAVEQRVHGCRGDPRLVPQEQDHHVAVRINRIDGNCDRGRAALAEVPVLEHLRARQVDGRPDLVDHAAADDADQLVEVAGARRRKRVVQQRRAAVREQLLRLAEALRATRGQNEAGDPRP